MGYRISIVGVILALAVASAGMWAVMRPLTEPLPVSGATDITISRLAWNAWQISYYTTANAGEQLESHDWSSPDDSQYGPLSRSYMRISSLGVGELREAAFVWRDPIKPQLSHIRIQRWIMFPW